MRKDSERQAWERIRESLSSGKVSFQTFRMSVKETDELLGEDDAEGQVLLCQHFAQTKMSKTRTKRGTGWTGGAI